MTATEHVILVDEEDNPLGTAEKLTAHRDNLCHRAFSVFVYRHKPVLEHQIPLEKAYVIDEARLDVVPRLVRGIQKSISGIFERTDALTGARNQHISLFQRELLVVEILLQQRASDKYHSSNLWTNTCCSHPRPGEDTIAAGKRRLKEEMGIDTELTRAGKFHYIAHFDNGLTENEVDHVLIGTVEGDFQVNPHEVQDYRWVSVNDLKKEMAACPENFTPWLAEALAIAEQALAVLMNAM